MDRRIPSSTDPPSPDSPVSDRLESWKEISRYLHRDIRTVQRWEASGGLPVYRHPHSKHGSIFAYKSEIDLWWKGRPPASRQRQTEATTPQMHAQARFKALIPQLALYCVLVVVLAFSIAKAKQMFLTHSLASSTTSANTHIPVIAVLSFDSLTTSPSDQAIATSITTQITRDIAKNNAFTIADQRLVSRIKNNTGDPRQIAQLLHSSELLRGTAGRSGNNIRITVELIDGFTGNAIWSAQYERNAEDPAEVQMQIANTIAGNVENVLIHTRQPQA